MYLEQEEISAILMVIDFENCFDSIDHNSLFEAMAYFNIGPHYISWVKMIYNGFEFCVINNGRWSIYYPQKRGVHQGSALSGPLFLFVAEILALNIKMNKNIKGIEIAGYTETISQYADDTNIWSLFQEESIKEIINELEKFHGSTGLKVNYEKTIIYRVGAIKGSNKTIKIDKNIRWSNQHIDTLGLLVSLDDLMDVKELNFATVVDKISANLKVWAPRGLTLLGKVEIVNALVGSLLVYKMQNMPIISKSLLSKIEAMVSRFIWNSRKPKIRNQSLTYSKSQGGRKLVNIMLRDIATKANWVQQIYKSEDPVVVQLAYYFLNTGIRNSIFWECNLAEEDVKFFKCRNKFWNDVLKAWARFNYECPVKQEDIYDQILWYNSNIKINNRLVFYGKAFDKGLLYVRDLYEKCSVMSYEQFCTKYGNVLNLMEYNSLLDALPTAWRKLSSEEEDHEIKDSYFQELLESKKVVSVIYARLNEENTCIPRLVGIWETKLAEAVDEEDICASFVNINKFTNVVKYRSFQYRLMHNAILLNDRLVYMKIVATDRCYLCGKAKETYVHLFCECEYVKIIWSELGKYCNDEVVFSTKRILFNQVHDNPVNYTNLMVLIAKQHIYTCKVAKRKPRTKAILNEVEFIHKVEYEQAVITNGHKKYNAHWPDKIVEKKNESNINEEVMLYIQQMPEIP